MTVCIIYQYNSYIREVRALLTSLVTSSPLYDFRDTSYHTSRKRREEFDEGWLPCYPPTPNLHTRPTSTHDHKHLRIKISKSRVQTGHSWIIYFSHSGKTLFNLKFEIKWCYTLEYPDNGHCPWVPTFNGRIDAGPCRHLRHEGWACSSRSHRLFDHRRCWVYLQLHN